MQPNLALEPANSAELPQQMHLTHFIGGERVAGDATLESINPSNTDEIVARFPAAGSSEVAAAVGAARKAFPAWANASPELRSDVLERVSSMLFSRATELAHLLSREEGKPRAEATGEVLRAARIFRYFAGEALRRHGSTLESTRPGVDVATHREAVGVLGLITPWNFPIAIPAWKCAPALAFGNTVVLKPADVTPAIAYAFASIISEAGVPAGVLNLVLGGAATGREIVAHEGVDGLSFTGSQAVGAQVAAGAVARQAKVQLEMGGKNPLVVLDDADLERAVMIAVDGAFLQTGQRCTASSKIIVQAGIYDQFMKLLVQRTESLIVGPALDPSTQIGPVATRMQLEKNFRYLDIARGEGARVLTGGEPLQCKFPGFYMRPAVIAAPDQTMRINREEVFGPLASVLVVKDYEEALAVANEGPFGLSAGIATTSIKYVRHFRRHVRAGMVMINLPTAGVDYHVPFGGTRRSSYGAREQGFAAVDFYTQVKTVYSGD